MTGPQCDCCWRATDDQGKDLVLGSLAMPGRRVFKVCHECVNFMWHGRQPMADGSDD